jgi:hypothetical protein
MPRTRAKAHCTKYVGNIPRLATSSWSIFLFRKSTEQRYLRISCMTGCRVPYHAKDVGKDTKNEGYGAYVFCEKLAVLQ